MASAAFSAPARALNSGLEFGAKAIGYGGALAQVAWLFHLGLVKSVLYANH